MSAASSKCVQQYNTGIVGERCWSFPYEGEITWNILHVFKLYSEISVCAFVLLRNVDLSGRAEAKRVIYS